MPTKELIQNISEMRKITLVTADNYHTSQFNIEAGYQCIIGRADSLTAFYPAVDLTNLGGYRMGVSRTHAILELINGTVYITDHSSNGTYVNDTQINKGQRFPLENHNTVKFGELNFHIYIQA